MHTRDFLLEARKAAIDGEFDVSLASDKPVMRESGNEVLSFEPGAVNLERARDGLPMLFGHDQTRLIGRVHGVAVTGGRLRGRAKFFDTTEGREAAAAVAGGHREVSVGYLVEATAQRGNNVVVTRWTPYEASLVSIPADPSVGINRGHTMNTNTNEAPVTESTETAAETLSRSQRRAAAAAVEGERERVSEISAIAAHIPRGAELAQRSIAAGHTVEQFQAEAIRAMSNSPLPTADMPGAPYVQTNRHNGQYSLGRAIQSIVDPAAYLRTSGFEREISRELEKRSFRETQGIRVPASAIFGGVTRALLTSGSSGNMVETSVLGGSLVEVLRAASVVARMGSTLLSGLQGNVSIPRQTAGSSVSWVAENGAPGASDPVFDAISMTPKTMGALVDISRRVKIQSSVDIEQVVKADLAASLVTEYDRAAMFGSGASNQPVGIANTSGINTVVGGTNGATVTWAHVLELERKVAEREAIRNAQTTGYGINYATRAKLKQVPKASGVISDMVMGDQPADGAGLYVLNGYKAAVSTALPSNGTKGSGTALSTLLFGDWSQLFAAVWGELDLMVDPYSLSSAGGIRLVGLMDVDFALRHPEAFSVMTDAITV